MGITSEQKEAALRAYVAKRMTPRQFAEYIGYSYSGAITILLGRMWPKTPRPKGFMHPWPERKAQTVALRNRYSREEIDAALELSYRELARYMGVSHCTVHCWQNGTAKSRRARAEGGRP